jgi:hypothetical protein
VFVQRCVADEEDEDVVVMTVVLNLVVLTLVAGVAVGRDITLNVVRGWLAVCVLWGDMAWVGWHTILPGRRGDYAGCEV